MNDRYQGALSGDGMAALLAEAAFGVEALYRRSLNADRKCSTDQAVTYFVLFSIAMPC